jgi:molybdenum-dependent DNA-binding transcriptional regulator ModE
MHKKEFTNKQLTALEVLGQAGTYEAAAKEAGVSVQTIWRWLSIEHFREALIAEYEFEAQRAGLSLVRVQIQELEADIAELRSEDTSTEKKIKIAKRLVEEYIRRQTWEQRAAHKKAVA